MHLGVVVQQLSLVRPTTCAAFATFMNQFPFSGTARPQDWVTFIEAAQAACSGAHTVAKREALACVLDVVRLGAKSPHFPLLSVPVIAWELVQRVMEPRLFDQAGYGLCGPTTFAVHLAKTRPQAYVAFALQLLRSGSASVGTRTVTPGPAIRHHPPKRMADADWLVLASLRSSSESLEADHGSYGGTTFYEMVDWLRNAGYGTVVGAKAMKLSSGMDYFGAWALNKAGYGIVQAYPDAPDFLAKISNLHEPALNLSVASALLRSDWKVFLMISEKLASSVGANDPIERAVASSREAYTLVGTPMSAGAEAAIRAQAASKLAGDAANHWVMAKSIVMTPDRKVSVMRYSYGTKEATAPIDLDTFLKIYDGFVAIHELDPAAASASWAQLNASAPQAAPS